MADNLSYTGGRFLLSIANFNAGFIRKVSGGSIKAELATHNLGADNIVKKHITNIKYEDLTFEISGGMHKALYDWIEASFDKGHTFKNLDLTACDFDYQAKTTRIFENAFITEVAVPALAGDDNNPLYITVKVTPQRTIYQMAGGEKVKGDEDVASKKWYCSNFRLTLGDLPCSRVSKIDGFALKQSVIEDRVGAFRSPTKHPAKVEIDNLKITFSEADLQKWMDWHKSFIVDGLCADNNELTGAIEILGPDMKEVLLTVELDHCGLVSLTPGDQEANAEKIQSWTAEVYVEKMRFKFA